MKKSTLFAAATFVLLIVFSFATSASAQNEYRISQPIPDSISSLDIYDGWQVRIRHGEQSSVTIVTPCSVFFDEGNEPQISAVKGRELALRSNSQMPKSTVVEITLKHKLHYLCVNKNATVETDDLLFYGKGANVNIFEGATVSGRSWKGEKELEVDVEHDATLRLDTLQAADELTLLRAYRATVHCPVLISNNTKVRNDINSFGSLYQTDVARNLSVKNVNRSWTEHYEGTSVSFGLTSPVPLYMNNKSGSPYNRGENYRITMAASFLKPFRLAENFTFKPWLNFDVDWSRLLNSVSYNGNALQLNTPTSGEIPQQHLYSEHLGVKLQFNYSFGQRNPETGKKPFFLNFGVDAMYNVGERLVTRTMGTDNRWNRTREKTDVMNPWQLRAFVSLGSPVNLGGSIGLTYDLLPTFRTGTDADKIHTLGVTLSF